jgi:MFS family permease
MSVSVYANTVVRGMAGFYTTTFLSAAWSMIIPTIPVLAQYFSITAGGAAQIVTVFAIGKFIGTIIGGVVIDRMGTRIALVGGPLAGGIASLLAGGAPHRSRAGKRPRSAFGRLFGEHFQSRRAVPCLRPALSVFGGASGDGGEGDIRSERDSMKGNDPRK